MKVEIIRDYQKQETLGDLKVYDDTNLSLFLCHTIELPNKNNQHNISCIPEGTYKMKKIISPTKGHCFLICNVPGRSEVEMHIGNYAAGKKVDTKGCILPGMRFADANGDGNMDVVESTIALNHLMQILPNECELTIGS